MGVTFETFWEVFSLGLDNKNLNGGTRLGKLGFVWVNVGFKLVDLIFIQLSLSFLFSFSLYFMSCSCLDFVNLVLVFDFVWFKCLVFIVNPC